VELEEVSTPEQKCIGGPEQNASAGASGSPRG
jgi:hypothetical protein